MTAVPTSSICALDCAALRWTLFRVSLRHLSQLHHDCAHWCTSTPLPLHLLPDFGLQKSYDQNCQAAKLFACLHLTLTLRHFLLARTEIFDLTIEETADLCRHDEVWSKTPCGLMTMELLLKLQLQAWPSRFGFAYVHDMCRLTRSKSTLTVDQRPYSFTHFWPNNLTSAICWAIYSTDTLNRADECHLIDTRKHYCLAIAPLRGD